MPKPSVIAFVAAACVIAAGLYAFAGNPEWPEPLIPENAVTPVERAVDTWKKKPIAFRSYFQDYKPFNDYLEMGRGSCPPVKNRRVVDEHAVPMRVYRGDAYYHPVLLAQCGLKAYGRFLRGDKNAKDEALRITDKLIEMQADNGAFPYPFAFHYYLTGKDLPIGWTSGMAQGQVISLLARLYSATNDPKYVEAGNKALGYMTTLVSEGGVMTTMADLDPSLGDFIFFEEYVSKPANYTLNGYMFALLGIFDWAHMPGGSGATVEKAQEYFDRGIDTLVHVLPYYDMGRISAYDLGYITFPDKKPHISASYHAVHIYLLHALVSITGNKTLVEFEQRWTEYLEAIDGGK